MSPQLREQEVPSIGALLGDAVRRWGSRVALRRRREPLRWSVLSWTELGSKVDAVAAGFSGLGIGKGDRVAILSTTRLEWTLVDYGLLSMGAVSVPIYHSGTSGQVAHVLRDSAARVVVVENNEQLQKVVQQRESLPALEHVVLIEVMDVRDVDGGLLLDELVRDGRRLLREDEEQVERARAEVRSEDIATLVYSSGTTGPAKGVRLTHGNLLSATVALEGTMEVSPDDTTVLCLPLSHIFGRMGQYCALSHGYTIAYARRVDRLSEVLLEVRPTFFFGVPRLYERFYLEVVKGYEGMPPLLRGLVSRGVSSARADLAAGSHSGGTGGAGRVGKLLSRVHPGRLGRGLASSATEAVAEKAIFGPLREALGGRVRFCVSGGAPLSEDIASFFRLAGIEILEGYGLTETSGPATVNELGDNRLGTVGRPLPGVKIRVAADGEILIKGPTVFVGYHNLPLDTATALDDEGWFRTGDVGVFDEAGHLIITDRKKDILVTSGGKNVAPQQVEGLLRLSPYIADAVVFGDKRPHIVALLTLERSEVERFAREIGLPTDDWSALRRDHRIEKLVAAEVERANGRLASFESVRAYKVLRRGLTIEGGELTPTLKVRRQALSERFRPQIDSLYAGAPPA